MLERPVLLGVKGNLIRLNVMNTSNKNKGFSAIKMAGSGSLMQIILFLIAFGSIVNKNTISVEKFWSVSRYYLLIGVTCSVCIIYFGAIYRRAFFVHLFFSISTLSWVMPLLLAGFELSLKNIVLLFVIVILCFINVIASYKLTLNQLTSEDIPAAKSGRLDINRGLWDLDKHLVVDESRSTSESVAKILIPFGTILGTFLFRNFPSQITLIATLLNFVIATTIISGVGIHIAISRYISLIEKKRQQFIQIK